MIFPRSGEPEHPDIATFIWQSAQFFSWADLFSLFVLPFLLILFFPHCPPSLLFNFLPF